MTKNDSDDDERLTLSPRIPPIMLKVTKSYNSINRSLSSLVFLVLILFNKNNRIIHLDII
jgi:hypothetical protein